MTVIERMGSALIDLEIVTAEQWDALRGEGEPASGTALLERLRTTPAWWSAQRDPALSDYQYRLAVQALETGEPERLARWLRLGDYLVIGELGQGGMGVVYRAWDLPRRRTVALKRVKDRSKEARLRFRREADLLARLNHPSIAGLYNVLHVGGMELLVLEYVDGEPLSTLVRRRAKAGEELLWPVAVRWTIQILDALEHAHSRQVIHRDIKPGNIMVPYAPTEPVKLLDMGLAKCTDDAAGDAASMQLTRGNQVLGTSQYMAPEQWSGGGKAVPASDLYGLGGTLHFLLTARPPFPGEALGQLCIAHMQEPPPSVRERRPDVPETLDRLIQQMLAKKPAQRGTARELRLQLNRVVASVAVSDGTTQPTSTPSTPASPERKSTSRTGVASPTAETARNVQVTQIAPAPPTPMERVRELIDAARKWYRAEKANDATAILPAAMRLRRLTGAFWQDVRNEVRDRLVRWGWKPWAMAAGVVAAVGLLWRVLG